MHYGDSKGPSLYTSIALSRIYARQLGLALWSYFSPELLSDSVSSRQNGYTVLHLAVAGGHVGTADWLLRAGGEMLLFARNNVRHCPQYFTRGRKGGCRPCSIARKRKISSKAIHEPLVKDPYWPMVSGDS